MNLHRRANLVDRIATGVITTGGIAIIGAVILILVLIFQVAFPLLQKANQAATEAGADGADGAAPAPDDGSSDDGQGPTVEEVD